MSWARHLFLVAATFLAGLGAYLSFHDKVGAALINYAASVFALIFYYLPEFKEFSGFGVSAKLKEKVEEADELIGRLRNFMAPFAEILISNMARGGRFDSHMPRLMQYTLVERLEKELKAVGMNKEDIEEVKKDWHGYNIRDLAGSVLDDLRKELNSRMSEHRQRERDFPETIPEADQTEEFHEYHRKAAQLKNENDHVMELYGIREKRKMAEEIRTYIRSSQIFTEKEKSALLERNRETMEDLDYYIEHSRFRRLDDWLTEGDS